jgi:hypothetical protein
MDDPPLEPDPKTTRNERVKLTAAWLNTIGAASVTTGVIAPIVAYGLGATIVPGSRVIALSAFWLLGGVGGLHLLARRLLKGLRR